MNLVRLQYGGGSSIEPYTVIVSLDEKFKGQPVTLTQGTEIMRKTCPMIAPYEVEFKPMNDGVWVASSTTKDGKVVSVDTEPLLEWGTYNVTLESGFNFREWLNRGRVEKTFTSLDDVLADQPTVRQLMTVYASCDYLYESYLTDNTILDIIMNSTYGAKWLGLRDYVCDKFMSNETAKSTMLNSDNWEYILKDRVPIMTANNAPYGEASNYQVFDGNATTSASGTDFSYRFVNPICVNKMVSSASGGTLQVSDDGTNWKANDGGYHLYVRCHYSASTSVNTLQFYGRSLNVSVPNMLDDTSPYGETVSGPVFDTNYEAFKAFKNPPDSYGYGVPVNSTEGYIGYKFTRPVIARMASIKIYAGDLQTAGHGLVYDVEVRGSNGKDSSGNLIWEPLKTVKVTSVKKSGTEATVFGFDNDKAFQYYSLRITGHNLYISGSYQTLFRHVNFYCMDYTEREFEPGSNIKYIYDHGVELEEISLGSDATKQVNNILLSCTGDNNNACAYVQKTLTENLFRATIRNANILKSSYLIIASNPLNVVTPDAYSNLVQENAPNNFGLDVSNFKNSNKYIGVRTQGTSGAMLEILELWLE